MYNKKKRRNKPVILTADFFHRNQWQRHNTRMNLVLLGKKSFFWIFGINLWFRRDKYAAKAARQRREEENRSRIDRFGDITACSSGASNKSWRLTSSLTCNALTLFGIMCQDRRFPCFCCACCCCCGDCCDPAMPIVFSYNMLSFDNIELL